MFAFASTQVSARTLYLVLSFSAIGSSLFTFSVCSSRYSFPVRFQYPATNSTLVWANLESSGMSFLYFPVRMPCCRGEKAVRLRPCSW
jgi:hypothetical protein